MVYYKITTIDDWFIIIQNDLYRCIKMLEDKFVSFEIYNEWKSQNDTKNKFVEFTPEKFNKWLNNKNV